MKIPIYFLGTGQAIPTAKRNHTALLMKYKDENILIDCGEGTQRQFRKMKLNPCKITKILITHWHGDHILGLPGLFQTLQLNNYPKTLQIYGPKGTKKFISLLYKLFVPIGKLKIEVKEVSSGKFLETPDFFIEAFPLQHGIPTLAYRFIEKEKIRLDKNKIKKLNLPNSPKLKQLQEGKNIKHKGRTIKASSVTYKQKGRIISFVFDTKFCDCCIRASKNSDLLIAESTFLENSESGKNLAKEYKHLTAKQAAIIAKKAKSKKLILTHVSQRYEGSEKEIIKEAKKIFKPVSLAEDLMKVEI